MPHDRRSFLKRSAAAAGALVVRYAVPAAMLGGRLLSNVMRYGKPPFMRINLARFVPIR